VCTLSAALVSSALTKPIHVSAMPFFKIICDNAAPSFLVAWLISYTASLFSGNQATINHHNIAGFPSAAAQEVVSISHITGNVTCCSYKFTGDAVRDSSHINTFLMINRYHKAALVLFDYNLKRKQNSFIVVVIRSKRSNNDRCTIE
jgi:hypothetical protein